MFLTRVTCCHSWQWPKPSRYTLVGNVDRSSAKASRVLICCSALNTAGRSIVLTGLTPILEASVGAVRRPDFLHLAIATCKVDETFRTIFAKFRTIQRAQKLAGYGHAVSDTITRMPD